MKENVPGPECDNKSSYKGAVIAKYRCTQSNVRQRHGYNYAAIANETEII